MTALRIATVLSLSALAIACNNEANQPTEQTKAEPVVSSSAAMRQQRPMPPGSASGRGMRGARGAHRARGMSGRLITAALALDLKDDQRETVNKLQEDPTENGPPGDKPDGQKKSMEELNQEIAAGIKAGKIETAKLEPHYAAMDEAHKTRQEAEAKKLNDLHAALTPEQRKALVVAVKAKQTERPGMRPPDDAKEQPKVDPAEQKQRKAEFQKRELVRMTKELGLDEAQQKDVEKLLAKQKDEKPDFKATRDANDKRMDKLLTAFEKDTFDATKIELSAKPAMRDHAKQMVDYLNALLKIVKPEQRDKLAATVERGHGMHGGGMMGGGMMGGRGRGPGGPGGMGMRPRGPGAPSMPSDDDMDDMMDD